LDAVESSVPVAADPSVRVPALDGLRALAVSAVIVFHFAPRALPGGFLGVDVFFVVSGFFIARLVTMEVHRSGTIAVGHFLARRIRRLLPALALMTTAVVVASVLWLAVADRAFLRQELVGVLLNCANWVLLRSHGNYFATVGRPSPFQHTWSLAVEEQFYLVLPLLALAFRKTIRAHPLRIVAGALAAAVGSTVWMAHLASQTGDATRAYFGSDSHSMGLLVGVALGVVAGSPMGARIVERAHASTRTWFATPIALALLLAIGIPMWLCSGSSAALYRGGFLLFSLAGCALVALIVAFPRSAVARVLQTRAAVEIGLRSYSLYLWHWPVCVFVDSSSGLDGLALFGVRLVLTVVLAEISYRLVELPFRSGVVAARSGTRGAALAYATLATVSLVVALTIMRVPAPQPTELASALTALGVAPRAPGPGPVAPRSPAAARVATVRQPIAAPAPTAAPVPRPDVPIGVYGDSTAFLLGYDGALQRNVLHVAIWGDARASCGVVPGDPISAGRVMSVPARCMGWQQRWTLDAQARPDIPRVLMTGAWDVLDHRVDGRVVRFGTAEWTALVTRSYLDALHALTTGGGSVHVFELPCYGNGNVGDSFPERADPARIAAINTVITDLARQVPRVSVVRWRRLVCPNGQRVESVGGVRLWQADDVHLSEGGALVVWRWLLPQLAR
jgi:peptidoglycan/LPS O-acetylase OafA/YrhL